MMVCLEEKYGGLNIVCKIRFEGISRGIRKGGVF